MQQFSPLQRGLFVLNSKKVSPVRRIAVTGVLSAVATVLMMLEFPLPFVPSFLKFDFSELPALIAAFAYGPLEGVIVCLIKNLFKLITSATGGVGELANFLLGVCFTVPAGLLYRVKRRRSSALAGCITGTLIMAAVSVPINYWIVYPIYAKIMPIEAIIDAYRVFVPSVDGLLSALIIFNVPFTLLKGAADSAITFLIYKNVSPFLHGTGGKRKPVTDVPEKSELPEKDENRLERKRQ